MVTRPLTKNLRLESLTVRGFRGIQSLSIPRLGRVTLFAGKNGIGKTTILEAIQVYASRGHPGVIGKILRDRNELISTIDDDGNEISAPDLRALFFGRLNSSDSHFSIGPASESQELTIGAGINLWEGQPDEFDERTLESTQETALHIEFQGQPRDVPMRFFLRPILQRRPFVAKSESTSSPIQCESLGPSVLENDEIARLWDKVALTADENRALRALRMVYGEEVSGVAVVGDEGSYSRRGARRPIVRTMGHELPVPLRSLGDGATRIFSTAVALANSQDGFLIIDEAENGIHHSIQRDFWNMVIQTASENSAQVLATTHSWDCVVGFAQAAADIEDVEGVLIRLENGDGRIRAVEYSEANLRAAAEYGVEVR